MNTLGSYACVNTTDMSVIGGQGGRGGHGSVDIDTSSEGMANAVIQALSAANPNVVRETQLIRDETLIGLLIWLIILSIVVIIGLLITTVWAVKHNRLEKEEQRLYASVAMPGASPPGSPGPMPRGGYVAYTPPPEG